MPAILALIPRPLVGWLLKGAAALFVAFGVFKWIEHRGAAKAVAKIERKDKTNVAKATAAARRSSDPAARGVRDPYVRND